MPSVPELDTVGSGGSASSSKSSPSGPQASDYVFLTPPGIFSGAASDGSWRGREILPEAQEGTDPGQVIRTKVLPLPSLPCSDVGAGGVKNEYYLRQGKWTTEEETCVYTNQNTTTTAEL